MFLCNSENTIATLQALCGCKVAISSLEKWSAQLRLDHIANVIECAAITIPIEQGSDFAEQSAFALGLLWRYRCGGIWLINSFGVCRRGRW